MVDVTVRVNHRSHRTGGHRRRKRLFHGTCPLRTHTCIDDNGAVRGPDEHGAGKVIPNGRPHMFGYPLDPRRTDPFTAMGIQNRRRRNGFFCFSAFRIFSACDQQQEGEYQPRNRENFQELGNHRIAPFFLTLSRPGELWRFNAHFINAVIHLAQVGRCRL